MTQKLATYKTRLQLIAFERQLRLTKLHEETATFIAELYSELVAVKNAAKLGAEWIEAVSLVDRSEFAEVENRKKKIHELFEPKQLFFPREVVALVNAFLAKLDETVDILPRDLTSDPKGEAQKIEALKAMVSSLDPALEALDKAFRRLLGSDEKLDFGLLTEGK